MEIKAADVKALREKTGAGMMECKKALTECEGDFAKAEKLLKEKGLAALEKRADRATNEGKVFVKIDGKSCALAELSSETDFVARNEEFIAVGEEIVSRMIAKNIDTVTDELSNLLNDLATKIRENMSVKRVLLVKAKENESFTSYIHGDGAIGVVIQLAADKAEALENEKVKALAFDLALHVAAFNPLALDKSKIDPAYISEQTDIYRKQMDQDEKMKGKPANVLEGILQGKINKHLAEICFVDQGFVKDDKQSVAKILESVGKEVGAQLSISNYIYFRVGA